MKQTVASAPDPKYTHPLLTGRHPLELFTLVLCEFVGLPLVFGHVTAQSIEATLPHWLAITWGLSLSMGALVAFVGVFWRGTVIDALLIERIGIAAIAAAAFVYGIVILATVGFGGFAAACLVECFSVFLWKRYYDLGAVVKSIIKVVETERES